MSAEILQQPQLAEIQIIPGLGLNSRLKGTGFNLASEMKRFIENYNQNLASGKNPQEALAITTQESIMNIRTFTVEFVQSGAVLPNPSKVVEADGVNHMVGDNGVPVVNGTSGQERDGAVLWAVNVADAAVSYVEPGQVAVINNPKGWTGFINAEGKPIRYRNNMTMIHWIDKDGQLQNVTIVSDLDQKQSRRLSLDLEVAEDDLRGEAEEERVANIVRNPALLFFPEFKVSPAEYVLDRILRIRGNNPFRLGQEDGTVEFRSVEDIRRQIQDPAQLLKFNQDCEDYLLILKQFILGKIDSLNDPNTQIEIAKAIESTILNITLDYMPSSPSPKNFEKPVKEKDHEAVWISGHNWTGYADSYEFDRAAAYLRTRSGCPPVGSGGIQAISSLGTIMVLVAMAGAGISLDSLEPDSKGSLSFPCPACGHINKRPREGHVESCQNSACPNPAAVRC